MELRTNIEIESDSLYGIKLALLEAARLIDDETDPNVICIGVPSLIYTGKFHMAVTVLDN